MDHVGMLGREAWALRNSRPSFPISMALALTLTFIAALKAEHRVDYLVCTSCRDPSLLDPVRAAIMQEVEHMRVMRSEKPRYAALEDMIALIAVIWIAANTCDI